MLLPFEEYRSFYDQLGIAEDIAREHFENMVNASECIVSQYFEQPPAGDVLGIGLFDDSLSMADGIEWDNQLLTLFNQATDTRGDSP